MLIEGQNMLIFLRIYICSMFWTMSLFRTVILWLIARAQLQVRHEHCWYSHKMTHVCLA